VLNFIAIDLQLYKIFKITQFSFLAHSVHCMSFTCTQDEWEHAAVWHMLFAVVV